MSALAKAWLDRARGSVLMALGRLLRHDGIACRGERYKLIAAHPRGSEGEGTEGAFDESALMPIGPEPSEFVPLSRRTR